MAAEPPIGVDPTASARLLDAASEVDRRAERARQRVDELEQTLTELAAALASHEATVTQQRVPVAAATRAAPAGPRAQPPYAAPAVRLRARAVADGARMLAIELAVAGATRAAIAAQLQQRFGISDPEEILDGVLMPSGTSGA